MVIPNYNSSRYLAQLLESYQQHLSPEYEIDIIVVDDSNPEEAGKTQELCKQYGARYLWCQGNVAKKRNFGVKNSTFPVVFFTDSDCILDENTIGEHMRLYQTDSEIGAMYGVVEFYGPINWVWQVVERTGFLGAYSFARRMPYAPWAGAGNLSVKREVFEQINGFDETFLKAPGGEDVDLGVRINKAGYKIQCNPDAIVYHTRDTWNSYRRMHRRVFGYGRAHYHVINNHPDSVGKEYPRIAVAFLIVDLLLILKALLLRDVTPLFLILLFPLIVMIAQAIMVLNLNNLSLPKLFKEIAAHWLDMTFEWGITFETLKYKDFKGLWKKMIYAEKQLVYERDRKIIQAWSIFIGLVVVLMFL